nr:immunoglobulin light chain junction region [Macaca mulatta]
DYYCAVWHISGYIF